MKKIYSLMMFLAMACLILAGCGSGSSSAETSSGSEKKQTEAKDTLEKAKEEGVLVVGSSNDAPFSYVDKDTKEYSGIDADILKEVAKRLGIPKVEMKEIKFENLLLELNNGNIDIVADGMYRKPEREKIVLFTDIWYKQGEVLVVPKNSTIAGLDDLKGKVVGAQKGTTFLEMAQRLKDEGKIGQVSTFGSSAELLLAANTGKIDATLIDGVVAAYSLKTDASLNLKLVTPYEAEAVGYIASSVRKEDTALAEAINKELKELKESGYILEVLKSYGLNEDFFVPGPDPEK